MLQKQDKKKITTSVTAMHNVRTTRLETSELCMFSNCQHLSMLC